MRVLRISESQWLNVTPESVWRMLETLEEWPRWNGVIRCARWHGHGGWRAGHRFSVSFRQIPRPWAGDARVGSVEFRHRLEWSARFLLFETRYRLTLDPQAPGTRVTFSAELRGWAARVAGRQFIAGRLSRSLRAFLAQLRDAGERVVGQVSL